MRSLLIMAALYLFAFNTHASSVSPKLCGQGDLSAMSEAAQEMARSGFDEIRYAHGIGVNGGDCYNLNSLEEAAGILHPPNATRPACAIIFTLKPAQERQQAIWLLQSLGRSYRTRSGKILPICAQVGDTGPLPGVTVHN